ncbi:hypothetical protein [Mesorhizobium sp.]|uniref:hypothetical protein n=1 Tax=Mesorhizobium sp. TaxID=1871066 RepID=UPI000FE3FE88|nr:hypothetical protein [Mesorhizobium sp.]RWH75386.1 MAG: hypothetical protein EOQ84_00035 [Mesorhizobium sp.]RWL19834.1 MAG: hypothetical protein EOR58_31945 [Mesorhizobium sp.]RWL27145.1 MAG: hypothetical protein EOR59_32100 [Mesorhizobium sp.]RWL33556.1 MAG: hypothetical protein EOR63_11205 [Mesorhizobium sp.]RWL42117.1 MAG: hypothetical protein EOR61_32350 [Mesorhizobium sp.]
MKKPASESPTVAKAKKTETTNARSIFLTSTGTQARLPSGEWCVADAMDIAKTLWGDHATTVVAWAALAAHLEGERPEFRFWFDVFVRLRAGASGSGPEDGMPRAPRRPFN